MIERDFDISFIAGLALREKQIQQNYRPVIAVHKWFARRPGALFRGLLLAEFATEPLPEAFFRSQNFKGLRIADPFMGGGTPLLEANRTGCDVIGYDVNPMAHWIVSEEIQQIDLVAYRKATQRLRKQLEDKVGRLYRTRCGSCGFSAADVKYFLWVKVQRCHSCGTDVPLFPGFLLAENRRHPKNVLVCGSCGELNECEDRNQPGRCLACSRQLTTSGPAKRNHCACQSCGAVVSYPDKSLGVPRHRLFAIEYYCPNCKPSHHGRFYKKPDVDDHERVASAERSWRNTRPRFVPDDAILGGDESGRLHRWGYSRYAEMFNARQLLGLEWSSRLIAEQSDERIKHALATNLSDLLRYQNMLCRYDTAALKSLDIFSIHGFPVGLVQCESNLLGIPNSKAGLNVGSGGWSNIADKYSRAKTYCDYPFEVRPGKKANGRVHLTGEWIGECREVEKVKEVRSVDLRCGDAGAADADPIGFDAVLTDPPYFGNVQYAELMDFCYVWLRRLVGHEKASFSAPTTRNEKELTANENMNRGIGHFTEGLAAVFEKMADGMKLNAPLVFTYHHNKLEAYYPIAVAILDAGLSCTASLPCPAEMGASIHINKTSSSIVDTVFVCRRRNRTGQTVRADGTDLIGHLRSDVAKLRAGGVNVTAGDLQCVCYGHLTRMAVQHLQKGWEKQASTESKLGTVASHLQQLGGIPLVDEAVERELTEPAHHDKPLPLFDHVV